MSGNFRQGTGPTVQMRKKNGILWVLKVEFALEKPSLKIFGRKMEDFMLSCSQHQCACKHLIGQYWRTINTTNCFEFYSIWPKYVFTSISFGLWMHINFDLYLSKLISYRLSECEIKLGTIYSYCLFNKCWLFVHLTVFCCLLAVLVANYIWPNVELCES